VSSWAPAVPNELFPRLVDDVSWNEAGFSSLFILLSQICSAKFNLSTMLRVESLEDELLSGVELEYAVQDNSVNPSINELTAFFSQVS
jgi:hypothetical protein